MVSIHKYNILCLLKSIKNNLFLFKIDKVYFFNRQEHFPFRNFNILINRNASKEITEYIRNSPQYTELSKRSKPNTMISTLINTKCDISDHIQRHIYYFKNSSKFVISNGNEWCIFNCNDLIKKYKDVSNYININI